MRILLLTFLWFYPSLIMAQVAEPGSFSYDGVKREHYLYLPPSYGPKTPLVVALHGMGGNAKNFRFGIGLTRRAAKEEFAVIYPQGVRLPQGSRHWNAGFSFSNVDDLGYLDALIGKIQTEYGFAPDNLYVFGISNGGYMAYRMACRRNTAVREIISVAATMSEADWQDCPTTHPVSVLHIHGTADPKIHFSGVAEGMSGWQNAPAVPILVQRWARLQKAVPVAHKTNKPFLLESRYRNETVDVEVQMIAIKGYGHDWPNLSNGPINALDYVMAFINRVSRPISQHKNTTKNSIGG